MIVNEKFVNITSLRKGNVFEDDDQLYKFIKILNKNKGIYRVLVKDLSVNDEIEITYDSNDQVKFIK